MSPTQSNGPRFWTILTPAGFPIHHLKGLANIFQETSKQLGPGAQLSASKKQFSFSGSLSISLACSAAYAHSSSTYKSLLKVRICVPYAYLSISQLAGEYCNVHCQYYSPYRDVFPDTSLEGWINDERMAVHCLESGCIRLYIPSDLEISLGPRDVPRASPSGHLSGLGKSLGRRGCTTQYIPPLGSVRIQ